uniref:Nucleoporin 188 n=1 Tax=Rattus norvegicus TaxID=10116 RepID=A0A8I5Y6G4_RAT
MAAAAGGPCVRSSRELWTILLGRSALRELNQIEAELNKHWQRLLEGLSYYRPPSPSSAERVKANKDVASPLKELGLRVSKFLGLDEEQSVQLLQCYLQEAYRGTRDSLKTVLQDERQSQALTLKRPQLGSDPWQDALPAVLGHSLPFFLWLW